MKKRIGLICALLLVLVLVFVSCGGETLGPETTEGTLQPETTGAPETTACTHDNMKVTVTEQATCDRDGYEDKVCETCGYTEHTVLAGGHDFEQTYVAATDADLSTCKRCGLNGYLLYANDTLELSGYFGGEIRFLATALEIGRAHV